MTNLIYSFDTSYNDMSTVMIKMTAPEGNTCVRPDFLTRVDSQLYRIRTVTAESREVR